MVDRKIENFLELTKPIDHDEIFVLFNISIRNKFKIFTDSIDRIILEIELQKLKDYPNEELIQLDEKRIEVLRKNLKTLHYVVETFEEEFNSIVK